MIGGAVGFSLSGYQTLTLPHGLPSLPINIKHSILDWTTREVRKAWQDWLQGISSAQFSDEHSGFWRI